MRTIREFMRKTKRGNILKIAREHYFRDDLGCGSVVCEDCFQDETTAVLMLERCVKSTLFPFAHFIILDTNFVLNQIHVLEENALNNVIVLTTVLNEVKHNSSVIYKRFNDIIKQKERSFYVFVNEHHKDTYVEREPNESANDRNDRAIRVAVKWYDEHLKSLSKKLRSKEEVARVVLLTDDTNNFNIAQENGLLVARAEEYIKSLVDFPMLIDKYASKNHENFKNSTAIYEAHLSKEEVLLGIKANRLLQGNYMASRENYLEGTVFVENYDNPILVQGLEAINRAIDGDKVAIELLPESEWSAPSEVVLEDVNSSVDDDSLEQTDDNVDMLINKKSTNANKQPTGKIVAIVRRKWRQYCGILQQNQSVKNTPYHIFLPADRKIPHVRVETRQADKLQGQRIVVAIDSWPRTSRYPNGHFVRCLGRLGDMNTENEVILLEHDVPHSKFSDEVLSFLPKMPWIITEADYAARVDLREYNVCSVDPPGCTDIDDALHCRILDNGHYEVGVHIADVSHFIRPGNALDAEAASRGTTVYLVGKRIDMIPELLSSNLCSLMDGVERFAFSCVWELDAQAQIVDTKFHKSVIKSKRAMTYEEAQLIIDDSTQQNELAKSLRNLNHLAKILKRKRMEKGALVLASPEIRFQVDSETHEPLDVDAKIIRETNSMVEEFMLLANISVAEYIAEQFPDIALLRRHPQPNPSNFEPLIKAARNQGFEIETETGLALANSLDLCIKKDNPYFNTMIRILTTRCMMQALYFISGTLQRKDFFHYGLAVPIYTHFTSPIRRYSDIIVHRLLAAAIGADDTHPQIFDKNSNQELCNNLNYRHKMAQHAGRASVALNTHLFFKGKTHDEKGYILFVRKNALQVLIPKFGLEGTLYLNAVKGVENDANSNTSRFVYNEEDHTQRCENIIFHAFDPVTVRLSVDDSNVQHEKLVFQLVWPYIEGFSVGDSKGAVDETKENLSIEKSPVKKRKKGKH